MRRGGVSESGIGFVLRKSSCDVLLLVIEDAQVQELLKSTIVFAAGIDAVVAEHAEGCGVVG